MGRLQTARLDNFIRRWGSIKGGGSVLSETLGDVFPVLDLENLPAELRLMAGISMVAGSGSATGGVGDLAGLQLINPVGTGVILVLTKFHVRNSTAQAVSCGLTDTLFTATINNRNLDSREEQNFNGAARIGGSTNAAAQLGDFLVETRANIDRDVDVPQGIAVITPGHAFQLTASATNEVMRATFWSYLRLAEASELNF